MWKLGLICVLCRIFVPMEGKRLKDRIYIPLKEARFCFRRTNGTGEFGCTSAMNGNVGILRRVDSREDLDWILGDAGGELAPYVALLNPETFTREVLEDLQSSGRVNGILLVKSPGEKPPSKTPYSDESVCPNSMSSLYKKTPDSCRKWNPGGQNLLLKDWSFPIMFVYDNETLHELDSCYRKFNTPFSNGHWPYCAVEMSSHMHSAVDTETCLRRNSLINSLRPITVCGPMGDANLFYTLKERQQPEGTDSVILVTTRLDSTTLFYRTEFGAVSPVTGIVTLLAVAAMLAKEPLTYNSGTKNVMFGFFHGESFDYIGSSRMVYDMSNGNFPSGKEEKNSGDYSTAKKQPPLHLKDLKFILELDQLASSFDGGKLYGHYDSKSSPKVQEYLKSLKSAASRVGMDFSESSILPPSSLQSFLKVERNLPGVVVSNFDEVFSDPYYHSVYDDASVAMDYDYDFGTGQDLVIRLAKVAEITAQFLYSQLTDTTKPELTADRDLINELLRCYIDTAQCKMFESVLPPQNTINFLTKEPFTQYVGVQWEQSLHSKMTYRLLALLTGTQLGPNFTYKNCSSPVKGSEINSYIFMKGLTPPPGYNESTCLADPKCGYCFNTTTFMTAAVSPAFIIDNYDFKNDTYAAWAESVWKKTSSRIFLKESSSLDITHFSIGVVIAVSSYFLMWWLNRKAHLLFSPIPSGNSSAIVTNDFSHAEAL